MCIVCRDWQAGKLTNKEALRNLGEMILAESEGAAHYYGVVENIMDKEMGPLQSDGDIDTAWHKETHGD